MCSYLYDYKAYKKRDQECFFFILLIFILLGGLRYRMGTDTVIYEYHYSSFPNLWNFFGFNYNTDPGLSRFGKGYLFIGSITKTFSDEFFLILLVQSIFVNSVVFFFLRKYSKAKYLAILIYFILCYFYFIFEIMREACAVALFLIAWKYFLDSDWKKYYLYCIIAVLFHTSALITFFIPILRIHAIKDIFQINRKFLIFLCIFTFGLSLLYARFFQIFEMINLLNVKEYTEIYSNSKLGGSSNRGLGSLLIYLVLYCAIPMLLVTYLRKYSIKKINYLSELETMICLYVIFTIASLYISLFFRFNNYFNLFYILLISDITYTKFKIRNLRYKLSYSLWILLITPILLPYIRGYFVGEDFRKIDMYYPYASIFTETKNPRREKIYAVREADLNQENIIDFQATEEEMDQ